MPTEKSIRELALELVDANDELCWINKHSHPQTWSALKNKYDKALDALRAALDGPDREKDRAPHLWAGAIEALDNYGLQTYEQVTAAMKELAQLRASAVLVTEEPELHHARAEIAFKQSDITALESRLARVTEAAQEARAALYGARESLGRIGNIQHAIDLCDAALADDAPGESEKKTPCGLCGAMLAAKDAK